MAFTVTESAITELKRIKDEQKLPEDVFVRVSIAAGGCSGFQYGLNFEESEKFNENSDQIEIDDNGIKVVIDKKSMFYLNGTKLDFYKDLARRGFTFDNPNASKSCGCGESFQV